MILSKEEIATKLTNLKLEKGKKPGEGDVITLLQICKHLGFSSYTLSIASLGLMSDKTQNILSRFFNMWESGKIKFTYTKKDGWVITYPELPIPRGQFSGKFGISFIEGKPRLGKKVGD